MTPKRVLNSRLGERLRYRMLRGLERREDEMMERALNGDKKALPIAYGVVLKHERMEQHALMKRNRWLTQKDGKTPNYGTVWMRNELKRRIELIQDGKLENKIMRKPLWEEVQEIFTDEQLKNLHDKGLIKDEIQETEMNANV